jgi:hypothetical protein
MSITIEAVAVADRVWPQGFGDLVGRDGLLSVEKNPGYYKMLHMAGEPKDFNKGK